MNIYDFTVKNNKDEDVSLSDYKGKVLLVINSATKCGLTPQYEGLEVLYKKYKGRGFEILDFPCNQFGEQAPESDEKISEFCSLNYGTTFPRFKKIDVNGENTLPLFSWLKESAPEDRYDDDAAAFEEKLKEYNIVRNNPSEILWNFGKFLIGKDGDIKERFSPAFNMESLEAEIVKQLAEQKSKYRKGYMKRLKKNPITKLGKSYNGEYLGLSTDWRIREVEFLDFRQDVKAVLCEFF